MRQRRRWGWVDVYQKATHLALDFDQESEAAKNPHTYCIAQGHISSHLPRDQLESETGKEAPSRKSSKDSAEPRLTSRQKVRTSERCEVMMGTSDSSSSSRASMASQAFACQTEGTGLLCSSLVDQAELPPKGPYFIYGDQSLHGHDQLGHQHPRKRLEDTR